MREWNQRKFFDKRVCPECGKKFPPGHVKEVRCSPKCKTAFKRRTDRERSHKKTPPRDKPLVRVCDWNDRGTRYGWQKYMEKNPFYLAGLYPGLDLAAAYQDMRARGAL